MLRFVGAGRWCRRRLPSDSVHSPRPSSLTTSQGVNALLQISFAIWKAAGLAATGCPRQATGVETPDLSALQRGDADAWDVAFRWLWPVVFTVAQGRLGQFLPADVEDVAIESLEEMVAVTKTLKHAEELKPLAASVAHNRAVSRLREHFAQKRGGGLTESLEARQELEGVSELAGGNSPLADVGRSELATLLTELQAELKPEQRALLADFFLHGLSYEQLAAKHGLAMGSVGVYLKRGLEALRRVCERQPERLKELEAFLR